MNSEDYNGHKIEAKPGGEKFLVVIALIILAGTDGLFAGTGCDYNPQANGSWIQYSVYVMGGIWNPRTKQVAIYWQHLSPVNPVQKWTFQDQTTPSLGKNVLYVTLDNGVPGLFDAVGIDQATGLQYFGDVGNPNGGLVNTPGEPEIPIKPVGGERLETDHWVANSQLGQTVYFIQHTSYYTIGHFPTWGSFQDCWYTSLEEIPPSDQSQPTVYQFVFARGIGLVLCWYGSLDKSGNVRGYAIYATSWGNQ